MKVLVAHEFRFSRARDGSVFTTSGYPRSFFSRYLRVFDEVVVLARVQDVGQDEPPAGADVLGDEQLRIHPLPGYVGVRKLLAGYCEVRAEARAALDGVDAMVLRAPGFVSHAVWRARPVRMPYAVEVVGDPREVFAAGASDHPARLLARSWAVRSLRRMVAGADAVGYVSGLVLPARYPASAEAVTACYSSAALEPEAFSPTSRRPRTIRSLVTVASLEQPYKGVDDLLRALARCPDELTLRVVGDGRYRPRLQELAIDLGLADRVDFLGQLPGSDAVRAVLATSDAFVLASRTEGLPRAMIEAMAAGLPCIGTEVGGIGELLPPGAMCPPSAPAALARLISRLHGSPTFAADLAATLHLRAHGYAAEELEARRDHIYRAIHALCTKRGRT